MSEKEMQVLGWQMLHVYRGILFQNQTFAEGNGEELVYRFDCPEFQQLRETYRLAEIAGTGSDFLRAKRLLHHFAPRLTHCPWYDNHIPCNALQLLEYSLDKPEQGINCLNKAKILAECCLALGIYARRIRILPYSPYDFDNHVVTEIYDKALEKWIMLDLSTDGYFIDEQKTPLSLLEMRSKFAQGEFITFVHSAESVKDLQKLQRKHLETNLYICKNLFYFQAEQDSAFGEKGQFLYFVPLHYGVKETQQANLRYRLENLPAEQEALRKILEERAAKLAQTPEPPKTALSRLQEKPC